MPHQCGRDAEAYHRGVAGSPGQMWPGEDPQRAGERDCEAADRRSPRRGRPGPAEPAGRHPPGLPVPAPARRRGSRCHHGCRGQLSREVPGDEREVAAARRLQTDWTTPGRLTPIRGRFFAPFSAGLMTETRGRCVSREAMSHVEARGATRVAPCLTTGAASCGRGRVIDSKAQIICAMCGIGLPQRKPHHFESPARTGGVYQPFKNGTLGFALSRRVWADHQPRAEDRPRTDSSDSHGKCAFSSCRPVTFADEDFFICCSRRMSRVDRPNSLAERGRRCRSRRGAEHPVTDAIGPAHRAADIPGFGEPQTPWLSVAAPEASRRMA